MSVMGSDNIRIKSRRVKKKDIGTDKINLIIIKLKRKLKRSKIGVALSAVQIGYPIRMFIVSGKIFPEKNKDMIFINPVIKYISKETSILDESCLSIKNTCGKINRSKITTITAYNQMGDKITIEASGLLSQIFQHEMEHLNGYLFIDNLNKTSKCKVAKLMKKFTLKYK